MNCKCGAYPCQECGHCNCPEWINIEQREPPQDCCVLVSIYDNRPKVEMSHVEIAYRMGKKWFEPRNGEIIDPKYGYVTHWMPLPESPKI